MIIIKTISAFALTIFAMTFFFPVGILAFILSFAGLKKPMSWLVYKIGQAWAIGIIFITGSKMEVIGRENIPKEDGICFVSNHVGMFDIILALAYIGRPFGFIAKKELIFLPFINVWIYILGGLFIDRNNIRKAINTINQGISKIQNGGNMLIFPEGTRSKGRGLLPFRSGAIKLATNSLAPIIPISIYGSYEVYEKHYRVHAANVRIEFSPIIVTKDMSKEERRNILTDQIRDIIQEKLDSVSYTEQLPKP